MAKLVCVNSVLGLAGAERGQSLSGQPLQLLSVVGPVRVM